METLKNIFISFFVVMALAGPAVSLAALPEVTCKTIVGEDTTEQGGTCLPTGNNRFALRDISSISELLIFILEVLLALVGIVALIFIVIGGYRYIVSAGGETDEAKKTILNALIGLIIVLIALALVRIVANLVGGNP